MKIYLVTDGDYSSYRVLGVFSSREKAERASVLWDANPVDESEVFELDAVPEGPPGMLPYRVYMGKDGSEAKCVRGSAEDVSRGVWISVSPMYDGCNATVWARDEQHAIKVLNERRIAILAAGRWAEGPVTD